MRKLILLILVLMAIGIAFVFAQDTTGTVPPQPITVPSGFNWWYIAIFAGGMIIHYVKKCWDIAGVAKLFKTALNNFAGWFVNKWHWTVIAGAGTTILALVEGYGLNIGFSALTGLGIAAALAAGYIGDSAFNEGIIKVPE